MIAGGRRAVRRHGRGARPRTSAAHPVDAELCAPGATLGRLSAGLAHEIKNPLHATMIRLELLKQLLADDEPRDTPPLLEHVAVIGAQMRRLDEVVQGFLKFIRPEELQLRPVQLSTILEAIMPVVEAEARSHGISPARGIFRANCRISTPTRRCWSRRS